MNVVTDSFAWIIYEVFSRGCRCEYRFSMAGYRELFSNYANSR